MTLIFPVSPSLHYWNLPLLTMHKAPLLSLSHLLVLEIPASPFLPPLSLAPEVWFFSNHGHFPFRIRLGTPHLPSSITFLLRLRDCFKTHCLAANSLASIQTRCLDGQKMAQPISKFSDYDFSYRTRKWSKNPLIFLCLCSLNALNYPFSCPK